MTTRIWKWMTKYGCIFGTLFFEHIFGTFFFEQVHWKGIINGEGKYAILKRSTCIQIKKHSCHHTFTHMSDKGEQNFNIYPDGPHPGWLKNQTN